jgi:hypothetical protein
MRMLKRHYMASITIAAIIGAIILAQVRVGPLPTADSNSMTSRGGRTGEVITQPSGGSNKERVRRGQCYYAAAQGAGVAPGTALGTTAHLVLYNPQNSGVLVVVRRVYDTYFSGTLGTGTMYHCVNQTTTQTAPSGGTLLTNSPALGGNNNASVAVCRTGATVVQPTIIAPFAYLPPELATTVTQLQPQYEDTEDGIQLLPGTSYQLQAVAAAGTAPLLAPAVFWEEQALLSGQP